MTRELPVQGELRPGVQALLPISNFIGFYGGRTDMESLTIVPYEWVSP